MLSRKWARSETAIFALVVTVAVAGFSAASGGAQPLGGIAQARSSTAVARWETPAREHRALPLTKAHGTLAIDEKGVEFRSSDGHVQRWTFEDIHTAFLGPRRLDLETYLNRSWRRPGEQRFRFDLTDAMPPAVAAALAVRIARPIQNADPDPNAPAIASIPVRHRTLTGGTNGVLRFRSGGIDYVTGARDDSRSWRWADLQTLSDPDPYHLFIFGYRDTYSFDLKAPLARALFNRATDEIYAHSERTPAYARGAAPQLNPQDTGAEENNE